VTEIGVPLTNAGTVRVQNGILSFTSFFEQLNDFGAVMDVYTVNSQIRGSNLQIEGGTLTGPGVLRAPKKTATRTTYI